METSDLIRKNHDSFSINREQTKQDLAKHLFHFSAARLHLWKSVTGLEIQVEYGGLANNSRSQFFPSLI